MTRIRKPDGSFRVNSTRPQGRRFDWAEQQELIPRIQQMIVDDHKSDLAIAEALGISDKTVQRFRRRRDLPNFYGQRPGQQAS